MTDFVIIIILALLLGGALWYMRKEKKKGVKCIGCPDAGTCKKKSCHLGQSHKEVISM